MKTRTFCPSCGGYRDIEDGHRICTFCEYLDEQRDGAKALSDGLSPRRVSVEGIDFTVTFAMDGEQIGIVIEASDPRYQVLADGLTTAWKLKPVELLESLADHRVVTVGGEFCTIIYGDNPEYGDGDPAGVTIFDGSDEINVPSAFFAALVATMARLHLRAAGAIHFPWLTMLSSAAKARLV